MKRSCYNILKEYKKSMRLVKKYDIVLFTPVCLYPQKKIKNEEDYDYIQKNREEILLFLNLHNIITNTKTYEYKKEN
jgi:hypothetical protein